MYSQVECLIELWRPVVALGLCGVFPLLVAEMRSNQVNLNKWPEHAGCLPLQVIGCHHCNKQTTPFEDPLCRGRGGDNLPASLIFHGLLRRHTFYSDFVLASTGMSEQINLNGDFSNWLLIAPVVDV